MARIKRITGERHTGHAGTLDPQASGVLPVCLGQATRVIEFLFDETKTYRTQVELGVTTDTYDATGKVVRRAGISGISPEIIQAALERFRGTILQTPPMYSAIKHHGQPLYKLARAGIEVDRKSRPVNIYSLQILDWQPPLANLEVVCGKGTYIRSLAHDLGEALGCGAFMQSLVRLKVGPFTLEESLTLSQVEEAFRTGNGERYLYPPDYVLTSFDALVLKKAQTCALVHGSPIRQDTAGKEPLPVKNGTLSRVYSDEGDFVGMVKYDAENDRWQPVKIFHRGCCIIKPEQENVDLH